MKDYKMASTNNLLIQVLARLKPTKCGVSDQAVWLAFELKAAFGIDTAFVVVNSTEPCDLPFQRIYCAQSQLLETCDRLNNGQPGALLVHVSGYGYSRDGAPRELGAALAKLRASGRYRIAAYFHELYATGMPWKSAFWYSRRQKNAVRRIAGDSDLVVTNSHYHADWLEQETVKRAALPTQILSVFSSVGETQDIVPMNIRRPSLVILGLPGTRKQAYQQLPPRARMLHDLGVEEILDVGPEMELPSELSGIPLKRMGVVPAADLASLLSHSRFGFVRHEPRHLAKSSVFSSYCALGAVALVAEPFDVEFDGLRDGVHVLSPRTARSTMAAGLDACSKRAWEWYSQHRVRVHAETYARLLMGLSTEHGSALHSLSSVAEA
jgi:hypothetical protein